MREEPAESLQCPFSNEAGHTSLLLPLVKAPRFYKQWMLLGDPSDYIDTLIKNFGDFVYCRGVTDFYLINSPDLIAQICKDTHRNFDKQTVIYKRFRHALGNGLVNSEGEHWKKQRKLINPSFSPVSLEGYFSQILKQTQSSIDSWGGSTSEEKVINFEQEMNHLTLQIAGAVLFSSSFEMKQKDIYDWVKVISKFSARPPIPIIGNPYFPRPLTFKTNKVLKNFQNFIRELIIERRDQPQEDDLFSLFLTMEDDDTGEKMNDQEIAEEVLGMIFGSHESTATAITWLLYELTQNKEGLEALVNEIDTVTKGDAIKFGDLSKLSYLESALYETLRLHPPFWFENRRVIQEVSLGGHRFKKGEVVAFSRYAVHRNPKIWDSPNDFNLKRFLDNDLKELFRSGKYLPFGMGTRLCIGRHFAMMELKIITVTLLQNFMISLDGHNTGEKATNLTMELKDGLTLKLIKR